MGRWDNALTVEHRAEVAILKKLNYLIRELRWIDSHFGIDEWVGSMTALNTLLQTIKRQGGSSQIRRTKRGHDLMSSTEQQVYTISPGCTDAIKAQPRERGSQLGTRREFIMG